jgi:hypothetical protein
MTSTWEDSVAKQLVDWRSLQEGQVFSVPKPKSFWTNRISACPEGALYEYKNGFIRNFPGGIALVRSPKNGGYSELDLPQEVQLEEVENMSVIQRLSAHSARVNSETGSDPEIFVVRGVKPSLLPAFKFLLTQEEAKRINRDNSYAYRDGFAAECYIHQVSCHGYLIDYLRDGLTAVLNKARTFDRTAKLTIKNTFSVPQVTMQSGSDEDVALGCMPSLNVYGDAPQLPNDARGFNMRFAGGHVHFNMPREKGRVEECVKACDIIAAIPAVAMFASVDSPIRRQYYGRAGEYRTPAHGLEYRVLSNAWLATPALAHLVLNLVRSGLKVGWNGLTKDLDIEPERVQEIINFCDVKGAREYVTKHKYVFETLMQGDGSLAGKPFQTIVEGGVEAVFPEYENVEKNWKINESTWMRHSDDLRASWGYLVNAWKK